ncbi:DUF6220 domain-containing protein [Nitrolancea hollandica]|uniref:Uncharacterized protein n=1 Tax=Nitrolancea hollandica Lb TaxID=1129897 RepID=I4EC75_9BACT|nr:DUF6220 domain-containing protein [Nitrolancea hollandica]CCF82287.1 conserved membrane hypothetical protein [Nitrolancea hollandica Lb]
MATGIGDTPGPGAAVDYGVVPETTGGFAWARTGYRALAWVLLACIAIQVFLAGLAVVNGPANWGMHTGFVHLFELLPLAMIPLAFLGQLPNRLRWHQLVVFLLIGLQYALIYGFPGLVGISAVAALHPVNALLIFWVTLGMARGSSMKRSPAVAG